jgi:hypothetical protein
MSRKFPILTTEQCALFRANPALDPTDPSRKKKLTANKGPYLDYLRQCGQAQPTQYGMQPMYIPGLPQQPQQPFGQQSQQPFGQHPFGQQPFGQQPFGQQPQQSQQTAIGFPQQGTFPVPNIQNLPPQPSFGLPQQNAVSKPIGLPQQPFGLPQQPFGLPQQTIGLPQQPFGLPQQTIGLPQQTIGLPQQNGVSKPFGLPQQPFGLPQQPFGLPQQNAVSKPFGLPQQPFGLPQPSFGLPQQTIGLPQQTIGLPQPSFGLPQPSFVGLPSGTISGINVGTTGVPTLTQRQVPPLSPGRIGQNLLVIYSTLDSTDLYLITVNAENSDLIADILSINTFFKGRDILNEHQREVFDNLDADLAEFIITDPLRLVNLNGVTVVNIGESNNNDDEDEYFSSEEDY